MRLQTLRRVLRQDDGITITELLVTMFVMSIVMAGTVALVIGVQRTSAQNVARTDQVDVARFAAERMAQTLRTSVMQSQLGCAGCTEDAFILGENYRVQFYANIDNPGNSVGPSKVTYYTTSTGTGLVDLHQTVQIPDSPVPAYDGYRYTNAANIVDSVIARDVRVDTGTPLFSYYDGSGTALAPSGGALTATQLANVLAIEVQVTVQEQVSNVAQPTTYVQRLMLPNAEAVIRQGEEETP